MYVLYVDESFSKNYILVGHLVAANRVGQLRKAIRSHVLSGQRSIHFSGERDSRRRYLLSQFSNLGCQLLVVEVTGMDNKGARAKSLQLMLDLLEKYGLTQIFIELDESTKKLDTQVLMKWKTENSSSIDFEFARRNEEPLLWLADAIAWCEGRGGDWLRRSASMIIGRIKYRH